MGREPCHPEKYRRSQFLLAAAIAQQVVVVKGNDPVGLQSVLQNQETVLLSVGATNAQVYEETYLHTAQTLVSALKQASTVRQLIYTGSYSVYGDRDGVWEDLAIRFKL